MDIRLPIFVLWVIIYFPSCCQKLAHIERPKSASAIFDVIQIVEIAWSEILLFYCKLNS